MKKLLLFDIDGTLIYSNRTGRVAMGRALERVFGRSGAVASYDFAGKTDRRIVTDLMTAEGWPPQEIETRFPQFIDEMAEAGRDLFTPERIQPCPGVLTLLDSLRQRDDTVIGLLTGNVHSTAPMKLKAAGIDPGWFSAGAYGSDRTERDELPAVALERIHAKIGETFDNQDIIILGDTPADIKCARAVNSMAIAVATGPISYDVLHTHLPDHLFSDFADTAAVMTAIFNTPNTPH